MEEKQGKNVIRRIFLWFRKKSGNDLEKSLGYEFKNPEYLAHALVHRSWLSGKEMPYWENNERLEFLGDSVLNMLVTEYLYKTYPHLPEGDLSKMKSVIVSGQALTKIARSWNLGSYLRVGKGEAKNGGRDRDSVLEDAFEAILGAIYLDSDIKQCRKFLEKHIFPNVQEVVSESDFINYKSALLEYMQARSLPAPDYEVVSESGPEHCKIFEMTVMYDGHEYGRGKGASKKKAEQEAAKEALAKFQAEEAAKTNEALLNTKPQKVTKRSIARTEKAAREAAKGKKK
ncbi:ribonuclease III [Hallerella porci]|uniref:Ribonuclease 3 n=1 Tax=Hallerella porci TaxID=1945871 RepID=A0ABX5LRP0_9BACT|nr:ribonuclease III [Hallerella porci]PWL03598.1 ribonuclease-3 [Hallerella porci]